MKILYLSYWGLEEGLTQATVLPNIEILSSYEKVEKITLFTIERGLTPAIPGHYKKIEFKFLKSSFSSFRFLNKLSDFILFPRILAREIKNESIDMMICRGTPAGAMGMMTLKGRNIPLVVESFEPHADYMLESGVWKRNSLSYRLQKKWEKQMTQNASFLVTVSNNYESKMLRSTKSAKILMAPCAVDVSKFRFNREHRNKIRTELGLEPETVLGIYVGKFGDIYLKEEFFKILKSLSGFLHSKFRFIILSPGEKNEIELLLSANDIPKNLVLIKSVPHNEVPKYLSAADYALTTVKPSPNRKYCSPIKSGEYWANGLPVFITEGIGDDSEIISRNKIGSVIDLKAIDSSVKFFLSLLKSRNRDEWNEMISPFAEKYRSFDLVKEVYSEILKEFD